MPWSNRKTIRRIDAARSIVTLAAEVTGAIPHVPSPVSAILSTTAKILEVALTVQRNKDEVHELAKFTHRVTEMVINRAGTLDTLDSQLQEDIAELQGVLDEVCTLIEKFRKRKNIIAVLAANSDKEEILKARTELAHMLEVFSASRTVEIQQNVVGIQQSVVKIQQNTTATNEKVDLLYLSSMQVHDATPPDGDKASERYTQQSAGRILTVSYQTPAGAGPEIVFAGVSAFFF